MYKVLKHNGGWFVFWIECPDAEPVPVPRPVLVPSDEDHKYDPYPQRQAAYRRCKKLNDMLKPIDQMIKRDGTIIV